MKVYALPEGIEAPKWSVDNYEAAEKQFLDDLTQWCKTRSNQPNSGKIVNYPMADGYARYMVLDERRSMSLIHLPLGDAYDLPEAHTRGLRKADIVHQIESQERMRKLFKR